MNGKRIVKIGWAVIAAVMLIVMLTGCIPSNVPADTPAGFFSGIWHGWIAPLSLVLSIFTDARIYEVNNTGFFYDLGFYMAIISGFGSLALSRKKKD